ncbi:MAG: alanine dehydrogenase [Hydrogenophilales bacterium]|nr:alanine dehydrogenase [Hydrogenophilales bacterium]
MLIGVPKEIKDHEFRVGVTPAGVHALVAAGHEVRVQTNAGAAIGFCDADYAASGAHIAPDAKAVYECPLIVKVKEPQPDELARLHEDQVLFCYLHLAASPELTQSLLQQKVMAVAYETITDAAGGLPLLIPMSEVAGRIAIHVGANCLHMANGGAGVLLGGVPGVAPGKVLVIGAGSVGTQAARMAVGLGADVTILDINLQRLRYLDDVFGPRLKTRYSEPRAIAELTREADLLVSSIYLPGKRAPKLITRDMVRGMKRGAVLVDVAIDQGGSSETSRPTTHTSPTYIEEGVVHYCVTNTPSAVAASATDALTHATLPFLLKLAQDPQATLREHPGLRGGLQLYRGQVTHAGLAEDLNLPYVSAESLLT